MRVGLTWLGILVLLPASLRAGEPEEVPFVGRPVEFPFSEASAGFARRGDELVVPFRLEARAAPTRVEVEQPLTLTVTIHALTRVRLPPRHIDLTQVPAFRRRFHIEDVTDSRKEQVDANTWRWVYRLRPRRLGRDEIPGVPFVFYNPDLRPEEKAFQVLFSDPIALTIDQAEVTLPVWDPPPGVLRLASGPGRLARQTPWSGPRPWALGAVLTLPPLLCAGWYLGWRRRYPDAARRARQRRSRAARRALTALEAASRRAGREHAELVAAALVAYLRERFDLGFGEPTPGESATWLVRQGLAEPLAEKLRQVLDACVAARFQPPPAGDGDLGGPAREFVVGVEEASWSS